MSNTDKLKTWAGQHLDGGMGVSQLLAPCWGQRCHSPGACVGTMEEIKLQPFLKHLCCQEEKCAAEQALRVPSPLPSCPRPLCQPG